MAKNIFTDNQQLTQNKKKTFISSDASSGDSTLTVQSIVGFAINQILCIGEIGAEDTEIIKTHASTSPTGTTVTLVTTLTFAHTQDTPVYIVDWDQLEFSHATTTTGTKSVLTTIAIQVDQNETLYKDTSKTSGFYFTRFKDTINTKYSDYSDPLPFAGYSDNMVFSIKQRSLDRVNEVIDDKLITHSFLDEKLWEARRIYHNSPGHRPFRRIMNYDLGNVIIGQYKVAVPSDLEAPTSNKNIFAIRIGTEKDLIYIEPDRMNVRYEDSPKTTLASDYAILDATITLTDSRDFPSSGSIKIEDDTIIYSANDVSTGALTVSTAGSDEHSEDDQVWNGGVSYGNPINYTVITDSDGTNYIQFDIPIDEEWENQNIYIDYYKTVVAKDSDADEMDEPDYDMYVDYLAFCIKNKKVNGNLSLSDPDYIKWIQKKENALRNEYLGQTIKFYV